MNKIKDWKLKYLITAGMNGVYHVDNAILLNQLISPTDKLGTIVPAQQPNPIIAICSLPGASYGKVKKGQKAIIEIDDYPSSEFGRIIGTVTRTSTIAEKDQSQNASYVVSIYIGDSLVTDYHKLISLSQRMQGNVKIITQKRRLLDRFLQNIVDLLNKNRN